VLLGAPIWAELCAEVNHKAYNDSKMTKISRLQETVNLLAYAFDGSNPSPTTISQPRDARAAFNQIVSRT
jgi:hypothetical protein